MRIGTTGSIKDPEKDLKLHIFAYGQPGTGKTHLIGDFPSPVLVTGEEGTLTLAARGLNIPVLYIDNENEFRGIVERPDLVTLNVIQKIPGFEAYQPETWAFDTLSRLQYRIMGEGRRKGIEAFDGVKLDDRAGYGILGSGLERSPEIKDYGQFNSKMKSLLSMIEQMPYHTIVTAHAGIDLTEESDKRLNAKNDDQTYMGYPQMIGSLKYDIAGLVSDFFVYLYTTDGCRFTMCPKPFGRFFARTRIAKVMPISLDWTDKNGYELLLNYFKQSLKEAERERNNKR